MISIFTVFCIVITTLFLVPCSCYFFFLMIRRPPRSTLFPTRRSSDLFIREHKLNETIDGDLTDIGIIVMGGLTNSRSEEHTSELQSHVNLVCRLLLEKKKKIKYNKQQ